MMKIVQVEFGIGQEVYVRVLKDTAIVIAVKIATELSVEYLCRWFHDGTPRVEYFSADEIMVPEDKPKSGFGVEVE